MTGLVGMPESHYLTFQLPEFDVVPVHELFGAYGFGRPDNADQCDIERARPVLRYKRASPACFRPKKPAVTTSAGAGTRLAAIGSYRGPFHVWNFGSRCEFAIWAGIVWSVCDVGFAQTRASHDFAGRAAT